jgi:hypothetical protein
MVDPGSPPRFYLRRTRRRDRAPTIGRGSPGYQPLRRQPQPNRHHRGGAGTLVKHNPAARGYTLDAQMATLRAIVASLADPSTEPEVKQ